MNKFVVCCRSHGLDSTHYYTGTSPAWSDKFEDAVAIEDRDHADLIARIEKHFYCYVLYYERARDNAHSERLGLNAILPDDKVTIRQNMDGTYTVQLASGAAYRITSDQKLVLIY